MRKNTALGVDVEATVPAFGGHIEGVAPLQYADTGVVDERGQGAEFVLDPIERGLMGIKIGNVEGCGHRGSARLGDRGDGVGKLIVVGRAVERDGEAFGGQYLSRRQSDTPA